jgi:hypothetical protein
MSSPEGEAEVTTRPGVGESVPALLDSAFGFFVWAAHLVAIYVATAVACALGPGAAGDGSRATFVTTLTLVTVAAIAVVLLHALRRYRQQRPVLEQHFRMSITVGSDALAAVAIAWQLMAIALAPMCS